MNIIPTFILLSLLSFRSHAIPPPYYNNSENVPEGGACGNGSYGTRTCAPTLTCFYNFIAPPAGYFWNRFGRCRPQTLVNTLKPCSIELCSKTGKHTLCSMDTLYLTCEGWPGARVYTQYPNQPEDLCSFACTAHCEKKRLLDSEKIKHCNLCTLQKRSCDTGFQVYGPVHRKNCNPPGEFNRLRCCQRRGIGCLGLRDRCDGSAVPCGEGLACVKVPEREDSVCLPL